MPESWPIIPELASMLNDVKNIYVLFDQSYPSYKLSDATSKCMSRWPVCKKSAGKIYGLWSLYFYQRLCESALFHEPGDDREEPGFFEKLCRLFPDAWMQIYFW